jgi:hypothetical protein
MARYLVIEFQDNESAEKLMEQVHRASASGALYRVVGLFIKPRNTCKCYRHEASNYQRVKLGQTGIRYGQKYGWWVCSRCNRPREAGHQLINQLGVGELAADTGEDNRHWIVTNLDIYSQDREQVKPMKRKKLLKRYKEK